MAEPGDWPGIWPVFLRVVRTGDTYLFDPQITEAEAREAWMLSGKRRRTYVAESVVFGTVPNAFRHATEDLNAVNAMCREL